MKKIKVCHLTTAHDPDDPRIFHKECVSLANHGYDVTLLAVNCEEYELNGVKVRSVQADKSTRLKRFINAPNALYKKALEIDADIYHFHDPDFIFAALKLQRKGKKVIYDSHEDFPRDVSSRTSTPAFLKGLVSFMITRIEKYILTRLSACISVTPQIVKRMSAYNLSTYLVTNYPLLDEANLSIKFNIKSNKTVFAGTVNRFRVIHNILDAAEQVKDLEIILAGAIQKGYDEELQAKPAWRKVNFLGYLTFAEVLRLYEDCLFGLVITDYHPVNYNNEGTLGTTKMFEYMMMGIPLIISDLTLYQEIIDRYECGISVNPRNVNEIAAAMQFFIDNPEEARKMGERGRQAVLEHYNWNTQEIVLLRAYEKIAKTIC